MVLNKTENIIYNIFIICYNFMGQILQIQIGQAGARIGCSFWEQIMKEHKLDIYGKLCESNSEELQNLSNFFEQQSDKTYRARALFADTQPSSLEKVMRSQMINMFPLQNFCYDNISTRNLWPVAYKGCSQLKNLIDESIRRQIERNDRFTGFHVIHSVCGGAGSGVSSLIQQIIRQKYKKYLIMNVTGLPSPKLSNIVVEPYNAMLCLEKINQAAGEPTVFFQNEAIFRLNKIMKAKTLVVDNSPKSYVDINKVLATALANLTSTSRFPCDGNTGLRKMSTNLIQYPTRKYLIFSQPYIQKKQQKTIKEMFRFNVLNFDKLSITCLTNPDKKKKMAGVFFVFRGNDWKSYDINKRIADFMDWKRYQRYSRRVEFKKAYFVQELAHNHIANVVKQSSNQQQNSVTSLQSNSIVTDYMNGIYQKTFQMLKKRAFLHSYTNEGIQLQQISQAQETILDIMNDYNTMVDDPECYEHQGYE